MDNNFENNSFENNSNEFASDVVSGVEQAPKKKGTKIAAIGIGAVVLAGGGSAIAYNCSDFVKNQVKLATLEPAEYYAWVTEESATELTKEFTDYYEKYIDKLKKGESASVSLKYEATDDVKSMLIDKMFGEAVEDEEVKSFVDMINGINTIEIGSNAQAKKGDTSGSVFASINDEKLVSAEYILNNSAMEYFFRVPELTEKWLSYNMKETLDSGNASVAGMYDSLMGFTKDPESYITAKEFETLVNKYVGVWTDSIKDVELEKKEKVEICDINVEYTVISTEINEEKLNKIAENFLNKASEDKLLKEIVTERFKICTAEEFDSAISNTLDEIKNDSVSESDSEEKKDNTATLVTYVDPKGTIRGIALEGNENEKLEYVMGLDGDKVRGVFEFVDGEESMKAELNATEKSKKKYDGEISIDVVSQDYDFETDDLKSETKTFSVEFSDFEIVDEEKGYMNANVTLVIPEFDPLSFTLSSDGKSQSLTFDLNIFNPDASNDDYGKITLKISNGKYDESKVPSADDAVKITEDFDVESYVKEEEVSAFIADLLKKIGLDEKNASALAESAAASLFNDFTTDDEEINWDDEEINWDDEEINWDDEEINWDDEEINWDDEEINWDDEEISLDEVE